jgi:hypothetical protein
MRRAVYLPVLAAAFLGAPAVRAQTADPAAAQGLFDAAKQLVAAGKLAEACPKFLASFRLDPKPGTVVNLADCYEKTGRVASAWARYLEAATLSQRAGQTEREQYAKDHAAALEPRIARLTVATTATTPGLEVLRDGAVEDAAVLGTPVPVDSGPHLIEARAPGKKPWSKSVDVPAGPGRIAVEIPALEDAVQAGPVARPPPRHDEAPPASPPAPRTGSARKPVGFAALAVGGVGVVVGAVTGGLAVGKHSSLAAACTPSGCVNQDGAISTYHTLGTISDVGLVAGGAIAVTGLVLVLTAPKTSPAQAAWVAPIVRPGFAGLKGSF